MTVIVLRPDEVAEKMSQHAKLAMQEVARSVVEAAMKGERVIRAHVPVDTGELRRETQTVTTGAQRGLVAAIIEDTPYAAAQEAGTRPFTPPIAPLYAWVVRQGGLLGVSGDEDAALALAYAIQRSIAKRGLRARWHTRDAQPELGVILEQELQHAVARLESGHAVLGAGPVMRGSLTSGGSAGSAPSLPARKRRRRRSALRRALARLGKRGRLIKRRARSGLKRLRMRSGVLARKYRRRLKAKSRDVRKVLRKRARALKRGARRYKKATVKAWKRRKRAVTKWARGKRRK